MCPLSGQLEALCPAAGSAITESYRCQLPSKGWAHISSVPVYWSPTPWQRLCPKVKHFKLVCCSVYTDISPLSLKTQSPERDGDVGRWMGWGGLGLACCCSRMARANLSWMENTIGWEQTHSSLGCKAEVNSKRQQGLGSAFTRN